MSSGLIENKRAMDYIFGYGSIINDSSRIATAKGTTCVSFKSKAAEDRGITDSQSDKETNYDQLEGGKYDLSVAAKVSNRFARRVWNFRCPTGFTALGVELKERNGIVGDKIGDSDDDTYDDYEEAGINGVLFPVQSHLDLTSFDIREVGYTRYAVPLEHIEVLPDLGCCAAKDRASLLQKRLTSSIADRPRIWIYVPDQSHTALPSVEYPILQTYIDVCIEGCLMWGGDRFALSFLQGTNEWSEYFLNDTPLSRRPWLHRKDYKRIDSCLESLSSWVCYSSRKHPDEFASLHLTSLRGTFGVPLRNSAFVGRNKFIELVHFNLSDNLDLDDKSNTNSFSLRQVEISGIGGVGKSQIAIEYAHRYFESGHYALVAWFRAESASSIATDMRKLAFELGIVNETQDESLDAKEDDVGKRTEGFDDAHVLNELMRRIRICRFNWLFIFDNVEDPSLLPHFLPWGRGGNGCGHVLVTTRMQQSDWVMRGSLLSLDCFDEEDSVAYLQKTLRIQRGTDFSFKIRSYENCLRQLSQKLGHLPLALSIAAAYMIRCDVTPQHYLMHLESVMDHGIDANMDSISSSLMMTITRISEEYKSAAIVLPCLGFIAPDNISKDIIKNYLSASLSNTASTQPGDASDWNSNFQLFLVYVVVICLWFMGLWWCHFDRIPQEAADVSQASLELEAHGYLSFVLGIGTGFLLSSSLSHVYTFLVDGDGHRQCHNKPSPIENNRMMKFYDAEDCSDLSIELIDSDNAVEVNKIWETMKQFSLLSVSGDTGMATVHRLQQRVLRSISKNKKFTCIERCIWTISKLWKFSSKDSDTWQSAGDNVEHIQVLGSHVIDALVDQGNNWSDNDSIKRFVRAEDCLLLSVLLQEGAVYMSLVLSRFDTAQMLLEWSHQIQTCLIEGEFMLHEDDELLGGRVQECLGTTLYHLGKILRYNDKLPESEFFLKQCLDLQRKRQEHGAVADCLHELGVLYLRKRDLYVAKSHLIKSLDIKNGCDRVYETDQSATLHQLGVVAILERHYDEAENLLRKALHLHTSVSALKFGDRCHRLETSRAATLQQLGRVELRRGNLTQADLFLSEALRIYTSVYGEKRSSSHVNVAGVRHQLGATALAAKQFDKACEHFSFALAAREIICSQSSGGKSHLIEELLALGQGEVERGGLSAAETLFLRAKSTIENCLSYHEDASTTFPAASEETPSYSLRLLSQCGYVDDMSSGHEAISDGFQRNRLVKQLFFCVHLLRGVSRQRGDSASASMYSALLKSLSKKYPSHHISRKKCVADSKSMAPNEKKPPSIIVVPNENSLSIFLRCPHLNFDCVESKCFSKISFGDADAAESNCHLFDKIKWASTARCDIRHLCKVVSNRDFDHGAGKDVVSFVSATLQSELQCLRDVDEIEISHAIDSFSEESTKDFDLHLSNKDVLKLLFGLSDDLRCAIHSHGYVLEDI